MGSKKARKKRKQKRVLQRVKSSLEEKGILQGRQLILNPSGQVKMSEVLENFVEPYWEYASTEDEMKKLLLVATVAWNAAMMEDEKRREFLRQVLNSTPEDVRDEVSKVLKEMIKRKQEEFGECVRNILDIKLTMTRNGPHLSVVSTMPKII